ncbi:hypothetical protein ACHABQ_08435 [Nesterenkonia aurantiaca]|uniref:hypothetical protein n=1 Tax=Nesterenkonia aurantiaca TaxID=1436010 RepID=UPI003EE65970
MTGSPSDHNQPPGGDDPLDALLNYSAPQGTPATHELQEELDRVSAQSRKKAGKSPQNGRFRLSRGTAVGLAAFLLVGGGTAAVAVTELRSYWADQGTEPHGAYEITLPSGAECEVEVRALSMGPPGVLDTGDFSMTEEQEALAEEMYSGTQARVNELMSSEDFDDEVQLERERLPDATEDVVYFYAVQTGLSWDIYQEYESSMEELRVGGEASGHSCPGADFEGSWLEELGDMDDYENTGGGAGG